MSSQRRPGKMMLDVKGRVLLGRVIDRLKQAKSLNKIIVATSDNPSDQSIADFCKFENIKCFRGSLNNVADRFRQIAEQEKAEAFVRINGDSPLMDPAIVDHAVKLFKQGECDLVTNVLPRTFPKGQSVEVIRYENFKAIFDSSMTDNQKEHVTKVYYDNPIIFRIVNFTSGMDLGKMNLCIDTNDDLTRIEKIIERLGDKPGNWRELATIYKTIQTKEIG